MKVRNAKTLLLGLAVLLITFSLFVALPAMVPAFDSVNLDGVIWACSYRGDPEIYHTWTWPTAEQPDSTEWLLNLLETVLYEAQVCKEIEEGTYTGKPEMGILEHIHRINADEGMGKLHFELNPENKNRFIVSGYLQYGTFPELEETDNTTENNGNTSENTTETLFDKLIRENPVPVKKGIMAYTPLTVELMNVYQGKMGKKTFETKTDVHGFFSFTLEADINAEYYNVIVKNKEDIFITKHVEIPVRIYLENKVLYSTRIQCKLERQPYVDYKVWMIPGLIIASAIFLVYAYLRRRRKWVRSDEVAEIEEVPQSEMTAQKTDTAAGGRQELIGITFPDILSNLPAVWGMGEPLQVEFRQKDGIRFSELKIDWGDDGEKIGIPDTEVQIRLIHMFILPGEYTIKASYEDTSTGNVISSWRKIRIVDYRGEMVRLFGEMLERLNLDDISIGADMTPREVERLLIEKLEGVSKESIKRVIDGFEEANYSTHPINRDSYVRMYRAIQDINTSAGMAIHNTDYAIQ